MIPRRHFLKTLAAGSLLPLPQSLRAAELPGAPRVVRIGLIADIHKDVMHDADERLRAFIQAMTAAKVDAILQMGDFCVPKPANQGFLNLWNTFAGERHHMIGNHDCDGGFKRQQVVDFWGMPARYYSFDLGGYHFIILDANDRPSGFKGGYPSSIAADQLEWLRQDLAHTELSTLVFSHQSLESDLTNRVEVRAVLDAAKTKEGKRKVAACFNGHRHVDHVNELNGIPYININSASYIWVGDKFKRERLDPALAARHPYVAYTVPYTEPVFTILEIRPDTAILSLTPCVSQWIKPGPDEIDYPPAGSQLTREMLYPGIRARKIALPK